MSSVQKEEEKEGRKMGRNGRRRKREGRSEQRLFCLYTCTVYLFGANDSGPRRITKGGSGWKTKNS